MTDSIRVIWEYLTGGSDLYGLVGTRVYSPEAPAIFRNTQPAIVYTMLDEEQRALPHNTLLVSFVCYGGLRGDSQDRSHDDARAVYRALHDRLRAADGATTASGTILMCTLESSGQDTGEDGTEWPVVECQYRFMIG